MRIDTYRICEYPGCFTLIKADYLKVTDSCVAIFYNDNDDVEAVFKEFDHIYKVKDENDNYTIKDNHD